jgi:tryptophan 2,3-dioxygenase
MTDAPRPPVPNYWDYLNLDALLSLQGGVEGDDAQLVPDELLFIVVHQTYELWFKQVLRELTEAIGLFRRGAVPEEQLPHVVHHLKRVAAIMRLAVEQFAVMETLTPQDFLGFRDKLVPASGFQSFQMRKLEILLGLEKAQREPYGSTDAMEHIRKLAQESPGGARAWSTIQEAAEKAGDGFTLKAVMRDWLYRTPIDASSPGDPGDEAIVEQFLERYHAAMIGFHAEQADRLAAASISPREEIDARFARSAAGARSFLFAEDVEDEAERARIRRVRAGLLYIESHRNLPLLAWPRLLIDTVVEVEEQMVLWRHRHARMVERVIGRRVGTGGSSGVEYLDRTTRARIFGELWTVRTLLMPKRLVPEAESAEFYYQVGSAPTP